MTNADLLADLSSNNAIPNCRTYADAGHTHLILKATEGIGYTWFEGNVVHAAARLAGLKVTRYHWLRPDSNARAQARYYAAAIEPYLGKPATKGVWPLDGDSLMGDVESTAGAADPNQVERAAQVDDFCDELGKLLPEFPILLYTGGWYVAGKPALQTAIRKWPVIDSAYVDTLPPNAYGFDRVAWQWTDATTFAGIAGRVDGNRWLIHGTGPTGGHGTDSSGTTPLSVLEAGVMFEIVQNAQSGHWYAWSAGYWNLLKSREELAAARQSQLCVNRAQLAKKGKGAAYRRSEHRIRTLRELALSGKEGL